MADAGRVDWKCFIAAGRNEEATGFIRCFPEGLIGLFDSSCFARFSKVFVTGFNIPCPVRFLEVDVGSTSPIIRGQFGVDGDDYWQMIAGQSDCIAMSLEAKLMSGEVDRPFNGSRVASFSLRMV